MASRAEWIERVAAWRASGATARAFCAEHGYAPSSLYLWASKLQGEKPGQRPSEAVKLARVVRAASVAREDDVVVEFGALRVRLSAAAARGHLEHVLVTLARMSAS